MDNGNFFIAHGDCRDKLKELDTNSIDSVVTDAPYELGFMGKSWDNTGIAYDVQLWKDVLRVLKPGGHLLCFGGSRTYHRMACAIEDAGFEIRDQLLWVYSSGFPKSHNVGKAYDKKMGNLREDLGKIKKPASSAATGNCLNMSVAVMPKDPRYTKGNSEYEGIGSALKPSHEPIVMARKPLSEKTIVDNVIKWGTGGINIDACRVPCDKEADKSQNRIMNQKVSNNSGWGMFPQGDVQVLDLDKGRFPANLMHDGSGEVLDVFPDKASRFFYCAKTSKKDRNQGLWGFKDKQKVFNGKSTNSSKAMKDVEARFTTLPSANNHTTVKPTKLMQYLVRLVTPKGGICLDLFMGSGTTGKAAMMEGFKFIGFEKEKDYCDIANARIKDAYDTYIFNK